MESIWYEDEDTGNIYINNGIEWLGDNPVVCEMLTHHEADIAPDVAINKINTDIGVELRIYPNVMKSMALLEELSLD